VDLLMCRYLGGGWVDVMMDKSVIWRWLGGYMDGCIFKFVVVGWMCGWMCR